MRTDGVLMLLITIAGSVVVTGGIRNYAIHKQVLDVPNERGSHNVPISRDGGWAIVLVFFAAAAWAWSQRTVSESLFWAFWGGGGLEAAIGLWDDPHTRCFAIPRADGGEASPYVVATPRLSDGGWGTHDPGWGTVLA